MKIFVCIKQVPDTESKIKFSSDHKTLDETGIKWIMNPYDEYAVEEAIKLRDANPGSQVHVVTLGPKRRAVEALRTALAMGADEAIVIDTELNVDHLTTGRALAKAIESEGGARVIFTGKLAIDDNAASVTQILAEGLNIPHATVVSKFNLSGEVITVERDVEGGAKEVVELNGPAVVAANKGLNTPRYASLPGIMKAKKKVIKELALDSLGLEKTASITIEGFELPPEKPPVKILTGDVSSQVEQLVKALRDETKVLS